MLKMEMGRCMIDGICGYVVSSVINGNFGNRVCDMIDNVCGNVCGMIYVYDVGENDVCGKINGKCCSSQTVTVAVCTVAVVPRGRHVL